MNNDKIANLFLTFFYLFLIGIIAGGGYYYFNIQKERNKMIFQEEQLGLTYGDNYSIDVKEEVKKSDVDWQSSNPNLVSVDSNGKISVNENKDGNAIITATTKDGKQSSVKVEVKETKVEHVTGIEISNNNITLKYGNTAKLNVNVYPFNASNKNIIWTSSNPSLVEVNGSGTIRAKSNKNGEATITAKTYDGGYTAKANVKVQWVDTSIKVSGVNINQSEQTIKYGQKIKLTATVSPSNATNKKVTWTSSNPSLIDIDSSGNIITKNNIDGNVIITAKTQDGSFTDQIKVNVTAVKTVHKVTGIKINETVSTLKYGNTKKLTATIYPSNATNKVVSWTSNNTSLVTVDASGNIKVVGNKTGTAIITVTTADGGFKSSVNVNVAAIKVTGLTLNKTSATLNYGASTKVTATVSPSNAANKNVTWTSSNPSLVTVDASGNIKAVSNTNGTAVITAKTQDGSFTKTVTITTKKITINPTGIKLNASNGTVYLNASNKTVKLTATVSPSNATNKNVTWASSNTNVATVSGGTVTAKGQGTANITATTASGGFVATYKITVKKKVIVVVTASQGVRMNKWFTSYKSSKGYSYSMSGKTLKYVYKSGSGFDFQLGEGFTGAKKFINDTYSSKKKYTEISLFFTLTGNSVRLSTCNQITNNKTDPSYTAIAKGYNDSVNALINSGYSVKGYVISHAPLQSKHPDASKHHIVYSTKSNACDAGKRSGWKYVLSNEKAQSVLKNYPNLTFVDNFSNFIKVKSRADRTFTWLRNYTTTDALHWDEATTKDYMTMAFNTAGM